MKSLEKAAQIAVKEILEISNFETETIKSGSAYLIYVKTNGLKCGFVSVDKFREGIWFGGRSSGVFSYRESENCFGSKIDEIFKKLNEAKNER